MSHNWRTTGWPWPTLGCRCEANEVHIFWSTGWFSTFFYFFFLVSVCDTQPRDVRAIFDEVRGVLPCTRLDGFGLYILLFFCSFLFLFCSKEICRPDGPEAERAERSRAPPLNMIPSVSVLYSCFGPALQSIWLTSGEAVRAAPTRWMGSRKVTGR